MNSDQDPQERKLPESLAEVNDLIKAKAKELLFAQAPQVPNLQQELQKLRIVARLYKEIENNETDDDLYKEMNLLNRMMTGKDLESEAERRKATEDIERASTKLRDNYGINPASASRIARAIAAVASRTEIEGPDVDPDPITPIDIQ